MPALPRPTQRSVVLGKLDCILPIVNEKPIKRGGCIYFPQRCNGLNLLNKITDHLGIGLMIVVSCLFMWAASLAAYANPRIRLLEDDIPDEAKKSPEASPQVESVSGAASPPAGG